MKAQQLVLVYRIDADRVYHQVCFDIVFLVIVGVVGRIVDQFVDYFAAKYTINVYKRAIHIK
jgi:hypothetical protein